MLDLVLAEAARKVRSRARLVIFWSAAWRWLAVGLACAACAVLLARFLLEWSPARAAWLLAAALAGPFAAWQLALRRAPRLDACVAWLDLNSGSGGRVMSAASAVEGDAWILAAREWLAEHTPRFEALPLRAAWIALPASAFAVAALWVPLRPLAAAPEPSVPSAAIEGLHAELQALAEAQLQPEALADYEQRLDRIESLAVEGKAESAWEALDALEERLDDAAKESSSSLAESAASLEAIASGESAGAAAQAELQRIAASLGIDPESASGASVDSPLQLGAELPQQAEQLLSRLEQRLGALRQSGLVESQHLQKLLERARRDVHKHDGACEGGCKDGGKLGRGKRGKSGRRGRDGDGEPGSGGVNRGRGDAEISWGDETPEHAAEMEQQALPHADALDLEQLELLSQSLVAPRADASGEAAGVASGATSAGAPIWTRTLAPRHRRAVESYFGAAQAPAADRAKPAPPAGGR